MRFTTSWEELIQGRRTQTPPQNKDVSAAAMLRSQRDCSDHLDSPAAVLPLTGLPTTSALCSVANAPGNPHSTRLASGASQRLVVPATAFCSWMTSGLLVKPTRPIPRGRLHSRPCPSTTSGFSRRIKASDCQSAANKRITPMARDIRFFPAQPGHTEMMQGQAGSGHQTLLNTPLCAHPIDPANPVRSARPATARAG